MHAHVAFTGSFVANIVPSAIGLSPLRARYPHAKSSLETDSMHQRPRGGGGVVGAGSTPQQALRGARKAEIHGYTGTLFERIIGALIA